MIGGVLEVAGGLVVAGGWVFARGNVDELGGALDVEIGRAIAGVGGLVVSANLGVTLHSPDWALAKFMKGITFPMEPISSKSFWKHRDDSMWAAMASKTMLQLSEEWPLPKPDCIKRLKDGKTLKAGWIWRLYKGRSTKTTPSVMKPVKPGMRCKLASKVPPSNS